MDIIFIDELEHLDKDKLIELLKDTYKTGYDYGKAKGYYEGYVAGLAAAPVNPGISNVPYYPQTPIITCGAIPDVSNISTESYTTTSATEPCVYDSAKKKFIPLSKLTTKKGETK